MPVFQYDTYRNPYGPSIAEALAHAADPQAAAALRSGDIEARAAEQRGALRAQQWSTLGGIPGAIQAQAAAQRQAAAQAQSLELGGLQLDAAKREARSRNLFEAESQNPANLNPDGTMNEDKFLAALRRQDVGAYQKAVALKQANQQASLAWTKGIADLAASSATAAEKRAQALKLRQDYLGTQALAAYTGLQQQPDDPLHARDWALGLATTAVADNAVSPQVANQWIRQLAGASPDQVGATLLRAVPPEMKAKYDKEQAEAAASRRSNVAAGGTVITTDPNAPTAPPTVLYTAPAKAESATAQELALDAFAQSLGKPNRTALTYPELQTFEANKERLQANASTQAHAANRQYDIAHPEPEKKRPQDLLEKDYVTLLKTPLSNRSGGLGLENGKVLQANHLLAMLEGAFDPATGTYNIPRVSQTELALGLARLVSPGGTVGIQMEEAINQRTLQGKLADALTFITGTPAPATPQGVAQMYKAMIERQGQIAVENREASLSYLRGLAPTGLDPARRTQLEAGEINPLRQSRVTRDAQTGRYVLEVSHDNGRTFAPEGGHAAPAAPGTTATPAPKEGTLGVVDGVPAVWKTVNGKAGWYKQ